MHFKLCNLVLAWKNKKNLNLKEKLQFLGEERRRYILSMGSQS